MQAITDSQWKSVSRGVSGVRGVSEDVKCLTSPGVLDQSKGSDGRCQKISQQKVAVVQVGQDHLLDKELSWVGGQEGTNSLNAVQEEPGQCYRCNVLWEGQPPRFFALEDEVTVVSPSEMEKSWKGEVRAEIKISYFILGLSFRWLSIQLWMSLGQSEI